jgi:hypothetical protein
MIFFNISNSALFANALKNILYAKDIISHLMHTMHIKLYVEMLCFPKNMGMQIFMIIQIDNICNFLTILMYYEQCDTTEYIHYLHRLETKSISSSYRHTNASNVISYPCLIQFDMSVLNFNSRDDCCQYLPT